MSRLAPTSPQVRARREEPRRRAGTALALTASLIGAVLLVGCTGDSGGSAAADGAEGLDLAGRTFTSTEVIGRALVTGTTVELSFEEEQISANAGCNTIFGGASWEDGTLTVPGELAMSMMACERGLEAQDQWLSSFLTSSPAIRLDGDTLVLGDDRQGITFTEGDS